MSLSVFERRILDLAVEDSYALAEIVLRVRDAYPDHPHRDVKEETRATIHALFRKGLIEVTKLEKPEGPEPALKGAAALVALDDDFNWIEMKHWRPHIRIVASSRGQAAFYDAACE
jgi:hypothetical protein